MSLQRHPHVASAVNPEIIQHYHAHVYYDPASSRDRAARLRERVAAIFPDVTLGRWHDAPVGPHTQSMYQLGFPPPLLASFLPWLMLNRDGLSILLTQAPATPTPIISITPSGWAACCRCGWTFCESRARRRHSPERFALSYEMKGAARARRRVIEERRLRSTFGLPSEASGTMEGATLARSRCNSHSRVS